MATVFTLCLQTIVERCSVYKLLDGIRLFVNAVVDYCIKQKSGGCQGTAAAAAASFFQVVEHRLDDLKINID